MARKTFEDLVAEAAEEERAAKAAAEQSGAQEEQHQEDENQQPPEDTPPQDEPPKEGPPKEEPPKEEPPKQEPPKQEPPRDTVIEEIDQTNSVIRKRLEKQAKKFEEEKAAIRAEYEAKLKAAQEAAPKPELKTREAFSTDEDYVAYLTRQQIDADRAEQDKKRQQQEAEDAKRREAEEAEAADIQRRQARFLTNIDSCFEGDDRVNFLNRVQYANSKGLGELLDANPIASDYLLGSQRGPLVLAKILDTQNPEYFRRVFPVGGINPLEQFAELKEIERDILEEKKAPSPAPAPAPEPKPKSAPAIGKPGVQGNGGTGGDPMRGDSKSRRDYVRSIMGY